MSAPTATPVEGAHRGIHSALKSIRRDTLTEGELAYAADRDHGAADEGTRNEQNDRKGSGNDRRQRDEEE